MKKSPPTSRAGIEIGNSTDRRERAMIEQARRALVEKELALTARLKMGPTIDTYNGRAYFTLYFQVGVAYRF